MTNGFLQGLFGLDGRTVLITGGAGGLGAALAEGFCAAGAAVAAADLKTEACAAAAAAVRNATGGTCRDFALDLCSRDSIDACVRAVGETLGGPDVLVNCAAVNHREPILEVERTTYESIMNVDLRGLYEISQAVVPGMTSRGGGKIINVGSINSERGLGGVSVYGAAKGAVKQLTMVMAIEWADRNIQVNCLAPGFMRTALSAALWADPAKRAWMESRIAQRRPGEPWEIVGMAILLASRASSYCTGQTFVVDGGFCAGGVSW